MAMLTPRGPLSRRTFLRGTGVALALPWLEAMSPRANSLANAGEISLGERPRRAVFCSWNLGINGRTYTPSETGLAYNLTPTLRPLAGLREDFTVISGLTLTNGGSHVGNPPVLTGTNGKKNCPNRISVDQELAEFCGRGNRFPSLALGLRRGTGSGGYTLSWSRQGTPLPAENRPHILFDRLFRTESPESIAAARRADALDSSVLDTVQNQARLLRSRLGTADRQKVEEYFSSIRDLEREMERERSWLERPRPRVTAPEFGDLRRLESAGDLKTFDFRRYQRLMFDMVVLALQTDSTRIITYSCRPENDGTGCYQFMGNPFADYHTLTHHGEDADKLRWMSQVDYWTMEEWAYFLNKLKSVREGEGTLLDHTMVAWGSPGGTVNAHNRDMLPAMLCGGRRIGVRHQGHIMKQGGLLGNLWQTMANRMGMPIPRDFQGGEANGVISELIA